MTSQYACLIVLRPLANKIADSVWLQPELEKEIIFLKRKKWKSKKEIKNKKNSTNRQFKLDGG